MCAETSILVIETFIFLQYSTDYADKAIHKLSMYHFTLVSSKSIWEAFYHFSFNFLTKAKTSIRVEMLALAVCNKFFDISLKNLLPFEILQTLTIFAKIVPKNFIKKRSLNCCIFNDNFV